MKIIGYSVYINGKRGGTVPNLNIEATNGPLEEEQKRILLEEQARHPNDTVKVYFSLSDNPAFDYQKFLA